MLLFLSFKVFGAGYGVAPFNDIVICSEDNFATPSDYQVLSTFSIYETVEGGFKKNQNKTLLLGLPTGFEFNTDSGSVNFGTGDISSVTVTKYATYLELNIVIPNTGGDDEFDTLYFENFYVRAISSNSGDLFRGGTASSGGTIRIDNSLSLPGDGTAKPAESLGSLFASGDMTYSGTVVTQNEISNVAPGFTNSEVIGVAITTSGTCNAISTTNFVFDTDGGNSTGTDNVASTVNNADLYYSGTSSVFSTASLFGSFTSPNGEFSITGTQTLAEGTNYFWLVYDLDLDAKTGDIIDAQCTHVTTNDAIDTLTTPNPIGSRLLSAYYLVASGGWSNSDNWSIDSCGGNGTDDNSTPDANDAVVLCDGYTVELDGNIIIGSVIIKDGGGISDAGNNRRLTINEYLYVYGTGTINMSGGNQFNVIGNASFLGTDTINVSGISTFEGDFYVETSTVYNQIGNQDFTLMGASNTINGKVNLLGDKNLIFGGNSSQYLYGSGTITSNNLASCVELINSNKIIGSTANLTIQPKIKFNDNDYSVTNNGVVTLQYNNVSTQGDLDCQSSNNIWINASSSTLNYGGLTTMFTSSGSLNASASNNTVNYNGAGSQSIIQPISNIYTNLSTAGSGTKILTGQLDVNGNVNITETSTFDTGGNNLTLAGNWDNASTFLPGVGLVTFDGTTDQYINNSNSSAETFYNVTINKASGEVNLTASSDVTVTNTLTLTSGLVNVNASNLIIDETATVTGFSDASFVKTDSTGYLRKNWASAGVFMFPVGDVDQLTKFTLQLLTANITAGAYTDMNVSCTKYEEIGVTSNYIDRFWDLSVSNITTPLYNFTGYYLDGDVEGDESLCVSKKYSSSWETFDSTNVSNNTISGSLATSFSKYAAFDDLVTLPVELIYFDAKLIDDYVYLEWETATELDNSHFEILRSQDGINFSSIGSVEGNGTSTELNSYQYWDDNIEEGAYYYKLKQFDFDGGFSESDVRAVNIYAPFDFIMFPNPSRGNSLCIRLNENYHSDVVLKIVDIYGHTYFEQNGLSNGTNILFDNQLANGTYFISIYSNKQILTQKLLVKKGSN